MSGKLKIWKGRTFANLRISFADTDMGELSTLATLRINKYDPRVRVQSTTRLAKHFKLKDGGRNSVPHIYLTNDIFHMNMNAHIKLFDCEIYFCLFSPNSLQILALSYQCMYEAEYML